MAYFLFILEGRAKVYSVMPNGRALLYYVYQGFGVVGDAELTGGTIASSYVQAMGDMQCIGVPLREGRELLLKDAAFTRMVLEGLAAKLVRNSHNHSVNLLYPVENRLAAYILLAQEGGRFAENLTTLAELLGCSYRQMLRVLDGFCARGLLQKRGRAAYRVENPAGLQALGQGIYHL